MMHMWTVGTDLVIAIALVAAWYLGFVRYNRKRAQQLLRWMCGACGCEGKILNVHWSTASRFQLQLQLPAEDFRDAHIKVELLPREMPLNWLISRLQKRQEALTFEANLTYPPAFNLQVQNYRWKHDVRPISRSNTLVLVRTGPVVLTTRGDWEQDLSHMMNGLLASRDCNFEKVEFRRESPHFSATLPLNWLDLNCQGATQLFEALRELATGASAAMF